MSSERARNRGNLFENVEKKKPSQPDFQGDCVIDGTPFEIRGYRREDEMTVNLAPPRGDRNTYPPDVFKGALEPVPQKKASQRNKDPDAAPTPAWAGEIESDEAAYKISLFEKQGKSGLYYTLSFEKTEKTQKHRANEYDEPADSDDSIA
ncbi:hypothetical protein BH11MYX3_BH11MYX3_03740 [soil metagenome]